MLTTTVHIPVSAAEIAELREREVARNEQLERDRLSRANRKAGKNEPRPGSKLYVATARGIKNRGRAGLVFSETPAEVLVVDKSDEEVRAMQAAGAYVVTPYGAEQILADSNEKHTGLVVFAAKAEAPAPSLDTLSDEQLEAELARRKARPSGMKPEERIGSTRANATATAKNDGKTEVDPPKVDPKTDAKADAKK